MTTAEPVFDLDFFVAGVGSSACAVAAAAASFVPAARLRLTVAGAVGAASIIDAEDEAGTLSEGESTRINV